MDFITSLCCLTCDVTQVTYGRFTQSINESGSHSECYDQFLALYVKRSVAQLECNQEVERTQSHLILELFKRIWSV